VQVISEYWIPLLGSLALIALVLAAVLYRRSRRQPSLRRAMSAVAVDRLENIVVPDGMGGEIYIEHLLLTARGLIVIDVKEYQGTIFGSDRMDEWTVIAAQRRFTFPNPQNTLYDRIAALRQFVRDVPVAGHVLFNQSADFSKGRPRDVILPAELEGHYGKLDRAESQRLLEAFAQHWDRVKDAAKPAARPSGGTRL
jgi:hypothetical protein